MVIMLRSNKTIETISIVFDLSIITMVISAGFALGYALAFMRTGTEAPVLLYMQCNGPTDGAFIFNRFKGSGFNLNDARSTSLRMLDVMTDVKRHDGCWTS